MDCDVWIKACKSAVMLLDTGAAAFSIVGCITLPSFNPLERIRPDWLRRGRDGLLAGQGAPTSRTGVRRGGATQYRGQYGRQRQASLAEHALSTGRMRVAALPSLIV